MITLEVPGKQYSTNAAYRAGRGRFWMLKEASDWKNLASLIGKRAMKGAAPITDPVGVGVDFHFASERPDADGPLKLVLDSLMPHVIRDDRQVRVIFIRKFVDRDHPRTVIQVARVKAWLPKG